MSAKRPGWGLLGRLLVCALLMAWIFHAIFQNEGKLAAKESGLEWSQLSRMDQWHWSWTHGPGELWKTVRLIKPLAFVESLGWMGLTLVLGVARWRMVMAVQGLHLTFRRAAGITWVAHFFNSFLLGSTGGDLIKALYAARETHHKKTEAVVTVFVDRIVGLWAMLLFAGIMMIPNLALIRQHETMEAVCGVILFMLAGASVVLGVGFWSGLSRKFPSARPLLRRLPKGEALEKSLDACRGFGKARGFLLKTLGVSMALNAVCVFQFMAVAKGLGLEIPPAALFAMVPMVICISALPITPSGLGVRENLFVMLLTVPEIGAPATLALAMSLLAFAGSLIWSLAGGVVYLFLKQREHLDEVTKAPLAEEPGEAA